MTALPLSLVAVCGTLELLTHVTAEPTLMVTDAGWKLKFPDAPVIFTVVAFGLVVAVGTGALVAVADAVLLPPPVPPVVAPPVVAQPARRASASNETYSALRDESRCLRVHWSIRRVIACITLHCSCMPITVTLVYRSDCYDAVRGEVTSVGRAWAPRSRAVSERICGYDGI